MWMKLGPGQVRRTEVRAKINLKTGILAVSDEWRQHRALQVAQMDDFVKTHHVDCRLCQIPRLRRSELLDTKWSKCVFSCEAHRPPFFTYNEPIIQPNHRSAMPVQDTLHKLCMSNLQLSLLSTLKMRWWLKVGLQYPLFCNMVPAGIMLGLINESPGL